MRRGCLDASGLWTTHTSIERGPFLALSERSNVDTPLYTGRG